MNVDIGAEAALFPEKEYINANAVAVCTNIFTIYEESLVIYMALNPIPLSFLIYEQNFILFFISVGLCLY
jgi:hypothetical protein